MLPQGVLGFQYEADRSSGGLTCRSISIWWKPSVLARQSASTCMWLARRLAGHSDGAGAYLAESGRRRLLGRLGAARGGPRLRGDPARSSGRAVGEASGGRRSHGGGAYASARCHPRQPHRRGWSGSMTLPHRRRWPAMRSFRQLRNSSAAYGRSIKRYWAASRRTSRRPRQRWTHTEPKPLRSRKSIDRPTRPPVCSLATCRH
jgi:hypothetical protein